MNVHFEVEEFAPVTPAQQLVDRFLLGYPRQGEFHAPGLAVSVHLPGEPENPALGRRQPEHGLRRAESLAGADAAVVVWRGAGARADATRLRRVLEGLPAGAACFVHGVLGNTLAEAREAVARAQARKIRLSAVTAAAFGPRLPSVRLLPGTRRREAFILSPGTAPEAPWEGVVGLLALLDEPPGQWGEPGPVAHARDQAVWEMFGRGTAPADLLAAAVSRSDSPLGAPERDGRTQDLAGLGLIPRQAEAARLWVVGFPGGFRLVLLAVTGVTRDRCAAWREGRGRILSTQLYQPPAPAQEHFSELAARLEDFLRGGPLPWPLSRSLLAAGLREQLA
ncbi:MAG: hypothetical protein ACKOET_04665 [Verrucomicrobiota bacterium]